MLTNLRDRAPAHPRDQRGFTLIELIIVIAIIGILVAIAFPLYGIFQQNARENTVESAAADGYKSAVIAHSDGADSTTPADVVLAMTTSSVEVEVAEGRTQPTDDFCVTATWVGDGASSVTPATRGDC